MKTTCKILGYATVLSVVACGAAIVLVPSVRQQAEQARDRFMGYYRERESDLIEALSSSDSEVAAARKHRASSSLESESIKEEELYEF